jgi:hypothetical protein
VFFHLNFSARKIAHWYFAIALANQFRLVLMGTNITTTSTVQANFTISKSALQAIKIDASLANGKERGIPKNLPFHKACSR